MVDGPVTLGPGRRCQYLDNRHAAAIGREIDARPLSFPTSQLRVHFLDLTTGKLSFDVEIQADQTKHKTDRPGVFGRGLYHERIDYVLQNKARAAEGVDVQLVVGGTHGIHRKNSLAKQGST